MAVEPCGDTWIDPDVQVFMEAQPALVHTWPKGSSKPIEDVPLAKAWL